MQNKLNELEWIKSVSESARNVALFHDRDGGLELWKAIGRVLKMPELSNEMRPLWEEAYRDAWFACFPIISDREVLEGVENHLLYLLDQEEFDILSAIKGKLVDFFVLEEREQFRGKIREACMKAHGNLSENIDLGEEKKPGTFQNWLTSYVQTVGSGKPDPLARAEFLVGRAVSRLSASEKARLTRLLELFDWLRLPSVGEGFEEDIVTETDGKIVMFQSQTGRVVEVDQSQDEMMSKTVPAILSALNEERAIQASEPTELEIEARKTGENMALDAAVRTIEDLFAGRGGKDVKNALAALYCGGKNGMKNFLQKLHPAFTKYLQGQPDADRLQPIVGFDVSSPQAFQIFLKCVFERGLGLSAAYGATLAGRLVGTLSEEDRKRYFGIAYYDFNTGEFMWGAL